MLEAHRLSENSFVYLHPVRGCTGTEQSVHAPKTECIRDQVHATIDN